MVPLVSGPIWPHFRTAGSSGSTDVLDGGLTSIGFIDTFNSDGSANAQVTLVWSDLAATQLAATPLVNGNDAVNPVEVVVGTAMAGTWEVRVSGTAVAIGPQHYTLITPTDAAANNRRPTANAGGPYATLEGMDVALNAGNSSDLDGDALTYAWDLDNDGAFDDATGPAPNFTSLDSNAPQSENTAVTVPGSAKDPGWLDPLTVTVGWNDGSPVQTLSGADITAQENSRPMRPLASA